MGYELIAVFWLLLVFLIFAVTLNFYLQQRQKDRPQISRDTSAVENAQNVQPVARGLLRYRFTRVLRGGATFAGTNAVPFWLYFIAIAIAEILTALIYPLIGVAIHSVILVTLLVQSAFISHQQKQLLILSLTLVPLIRILSLSLPLVRLPQIYWYPLIYAPLLAGTIVIIRIAGLKPAEVGMTARGLPLQLAFGIVTGIAFGTFEYLILRPEPLISELSLQALWLPALILLFTTGFVEELIFRGLLQTTAENAMGLWGIVYVCLVFAVLHMGFLSFPDMAFVLLVAFTFAAIRKKTGSLMGAILSHGIANSFLFLVGPFVLS